MTITPDPVVVTKTANLTRTLKTWTRTAVVYTSTATASCTVPPRPQQPDPPCTRWPRLIQVPSGVHIARDVKEDYASIKRRLADIRARRAAEIDARDLAKRTADAATITVTATVPVNSTVSFAFQICQARKNKKADKSIDHFHCRANNCSEHCLEQLDYHLVSSSATDPSPACIY